MRGRLRVPRALVVVVMSGAIVATAGSSCGGEECIPCVRDPRIGDAGTDGMAPVVCPACLPKDGVCPAGCVPDGFV
jgi:hypothetical protein